MAKDDQTTGATLPPVSTAKADTPAAALTARQALDAWFDQYIRNTPYAADTETWNRMQNAVRVIDTAIDRFDAAAAKIDALKKGQ